MAIRDFDETLHLQGVRAQLIELQDFERAIDPRMPTGAGIVDEYVPDMMERCKQCDGRILVAEIDGEVVGFATILSKVTSKDLDDGGLEYGLISDIVVAKTFRNRGVGRKLLEAAEAFARERNVKWLRIGVLAANQTADRLYESMGFERRYVEREKILNR
jgi:GNAT superfamily N-acetyltransferase